MICKRQVRNKYIFYNLLIISIFLFIPLAIAQIEKIEQARDIVNQLETEEGAKDFFKQKITDMFNNTGISPVLNKFETYMIKLNFIWKKIPGLEFELTFKFILAVMITYLIAIFSYRLIYLFNDIRWQNILGALGIAFILSWFGIIKLITNIITEYISSIESTSKQIFLGILILLLIIFLITITHVIKYLAKTNRKIIKQKKLENKVEQIEKKEKSKIRNEETEESENQKTGKKLLEELGKNVYKNAEERESIE